MFPRLTCSTSVQYGDIMEAAVIRDRHTGRSKGYGFVTFSQQEDAKAAVWETNPIIDGRKANCNLAAFGKKRSDNGRQKGSKGGRHRQEKGRSRHDYGPETHKEGNMRQGTWIGYMPQESMQYGYSPHQMAYLQQMGQVGYYPQQMAVTQMGFQGFQGHQQGRMSPQMPGEQSYPVFQPAYGMMDMRNHPMAYNLQGYPSHQVPMAAMVHQVAPGAAQGSPPGPVGGGLVVHGQPVGGYQEDMHKGQDVSLIDLNGMQHLGELSEPIGDLGMPDELHEEQ